MAEQTFIEIFTRIQIDDDFRKQVEKQPERALATFRLSSEQIDGVAVRAFWSPKLRALPIFGRLPAAELGRVLARLEEGHYPPGEVLMTQGDPGDWFHYIIKGKVEVLQAPGEDLTKSKRTATLGPGEHVGEIALRFNTPRNATVRAMTNVYTLSLEANDFRDLFRRLAVA